MIRKEMSALASIVLLVKFCTPALSSEHNNGAFELPWMTKPIYGTQLNVKASQRAPLEGLVQIFKEQKLIYTFQNQHLDAVFTLDNGNLATLWSGGAGSNCHLVVFAFVKGTVRKVLECGSNGLRPELAYLAKGQIKLSNTHDGNKSDLASKQFLKQSIIVGNVDWTGPHGKPRPVSADIYTWDEKKGLYVARKGIPWNERLRSNK